VRLDLLVDAARPALAPTSPILTGSPSTVEVTSVVHDSRAVTPGALFCCVVGTATDGHAYAEQAVDAGAVALLCERPLGLGLGVAEVQVPSVRAAMGPVAAAFHGWPSSRLTVVGVTGTNGKTTLTHLLASVLEADGRRCGVVGTLTGARTTPEAPELQAILAGMERDGVDAVAMEVSSHALAQERVGGTRFALAVFTNLSQDHLDFHGTMERYFRAKALLFEPERSERGVVCLDDPHGRLLRDTARIPVVGWSVEDATDVRIEPTGTTFGWRGQVVRIGLAGRFNLANAIGAATAAAELGVAPDVVAAGLATAGPVPGRFELVDEGQPFTVVVDYAHTPDGLDKVLAAARELTAGRVLVVFGSGGDRDPTKRPAMGQAAARGADVVVVTSDNPRFEDPHAIISSVLQGIDTEDGAVVEPDRRAAIAAALERAHPGDVVVIAGKGHETTQVTGEHVLPFDDRVVAREELRAGSRADRSEGRPA
jgi:UDP-N-acetylmuramoyl-L-alanyl-D-glutamate--2,6-diaminopimelate ligase